MGLLARFLRWVSKRYFPQSKESCFIFLLARSGETWQTCMVTGGRNSDSVPHASFEDAKDRIQMLVTQAVAPVEKSEPVQGGMKGEAK